MGGIGGRIYAPGFLALQNINSIFTLHKLQIHCYDNNDNKKNKERIKIREQRESKERKRLPQKNMLEVELDQFLAYTNP